MYSLGKRVSLPGNNQDTGKKDYLLKWKHKFGANKISSAWVNI